MWWWTWLGANVLYILSLILPFLSEKKTCTTFMMVSSSLNTYFVFFCSKGKFVVRVHTTGHPRTQRWVVHPAKLYTGIPQMCEMLIMKAQRNSQNINLVSGLRKGKGCRKKRESLGETTRTSYNSRKYQFGFNLLSK